MFENTNNELSKIIDLVHTSDNSETNKSIVVISGGFGSGKSYLVENIINSIIEEKFADCIINISNNNFTFIPELMHSSVLNIKTEFGYISEFGSESTYNLEQFKSYLDNLKKSNPNIFNAYCFSSKLKSQFEWAENYTLIKSQESIIYDSVKDLFPKKGELRLLFETYTVAIESLMVDLMNIFYPISDTENPIISKTGDKKKIILSFDNIDSINGSMYYFFINFVIPYCFTKTFGEFLSYHISFIDSNIKISDFFDFKLIIASRNDFINLNQSILQNLLPFVYKADLNYITEDEITSEMISITNTNLNTNKIFNICKGIPLLLAESQEIEISEFDYSKNIFKLAYTSIIKDLSIKEIDYLHILAFIDNLDEKSLSYFDKYKTSVNTLKNFLLFNPNLCSIDDKNKLKSEIIYYVFNYLIVYNKFEFDYLNNISKAVKSIKDIVTNFTNEEFNTLKLIAYLNEYDDKPVMNLALQDFTSIWDSLFKNNIDIFPNSKYKITSAIANKIIEFNKIVNISEHNKLNTLYVHLSESIEDNVRQEQTQKEVYLADLQKSLINIEAEVKNQKNLCKQYQENLMKTENTMIELRRKLSNNSMNSNIIIAAVNVIVTFLILGITYFLPSISGIKDENSPVYSIQIILYCIAVVFGGIGGFFSFKVFKNLSNSAEFKLIQEQIAELENIKNDLQNKMKQCKFNDEDLKNKISGMKKQIIELSNETK